MADCGPQPSDAAYLAAGKTHDQWLQDYYAWVNCVNGTQDPALKCPAGFHWEGPDDPVNGKCVANPVTIPVAGPVTPPTTPPTNPPTSPPTTPGPTAPGGTTKPATPASGTVTTTTPGTQPHYMGGFEPGSYCDIFPDDPICDLWGNGPGGVVFGGGGGTVIEQPIIIEEGLNAADVNSIVNGGLDTVWNATVGAVDVAIAAVVGGIQAAITDIGNAVKAAWTILSRLGGFILNLLQTLLRQIVAGLLRIVQDLRDLLREIYDKILKPLAQALGNLRDRLLDLYKRFIRPLLIIIQDIRRVLGILSLFHLKFAQKLDAQLANLERRITQPLFFLLQYTNAVSNWLNLIVTARYLIQKPMFLNSLSAYVGSSINLQLNAMTKPVSASDIAAANQLNALPSVAQSEAAGVQLLRTGAGPLGTVTSEAASSLNGYLAQGVF